MKVKVDKKLCMFCNFADKGNIIDGQPVCLSKMMGNGCRFGS